MAKRRVDRRDVASQLFGTLLDNTIDAAERLVTATPALVVRTPALVTQAVSRKIKERAPAADPLEVNGVIGPEEFDAVGE